MKLYDIVPLSKLAEHFERLPGIGRKTAQRLAYSVLQMEEDQIKDFASCMINVRSKIHYCKICCNLTDKDLCPICSNLNRDKSIICVVEDPRDIVIFEKSNEYNSQYHVIHGCISPLNGIGPDQLRIKELLLRVSKGDVKEVIMATNPTVEGEATAMYISKLLKPYDIKVTRIAFGIPFGSTLEYTDGETLGRAINGRIEI